MAFATPVLKGENQMENKIKIDWKDWKIYVFIAVFLLAAALMIFSFVNKFYTAEETCKSFPYLVIEYNNTNISNSTVTISNITIPYNRGICMGYVHYYNVTTAYGTRPTYNCSGDIIGGGTYNVSCNEGANKTVCLVYYNCSLAKKWRV